MLHVLTLKKLATSVFLSQEAGESPDSIADAPKVYSKFMTIPDLSNNVLKNCDLLFFFLLSSEFYWILTIENFKMPLCVQQSNMISCVNCEFMKTGLASTALNTDLPVKSFRYEFFYLINIALFLSRVENKSQHIYQCRAIFKL